MADRTSARNRLNTSQSPPKSHDAANAPQQSSPRRTTRATRSQSRDVSDSEAGRIGAKGGRRSTRQATGQGLQGAKNEKNANGSKEKPNALASAAQVDPELSVVAEESDVAYPNLQQSANHGLQLVDQSTPGALSGTTARTSIAKQALKDSNVQDMLDTLPDLSAAADKVAQWLIPEEVTEEVVASMRQDLLYPDSRLSKNVKRLSSVLQAQKGIYGDSIEDYISTQSVLTALLGSPEADDSDEPWYPNPMLHKANISTFLVIVTRSWGEAFNNDHLDFLEKFFPSPFLSRASTIEDFSAAVDVRTQHFIMLLTRYSDVPNFDPDIILQQAFYVSNSASPLKGWSAPGLKENDLNQEYQALIVRRMTDIRSHFSDGRAVHRPLKAAFPWNAFVTKMIAWSKSRLDEIDTLIQTHGGVEAIVEALSGEVQSRVASGALDLARNGTSPVVELSYPSPSAISNTASDRSSLNRLAAARSVSGRGTKVQFKTPGAMLVGAQYLRGLEARYAQYQNPNSQSMAPVAIMGPSQAPNGGMSNVAMVSNDEGFMSGALNGDDWQPAQIEDEPMGITPDTNPQAFAMGVLEAAMNKGNIAVNHQYAMPPPASTHRQALGPRKLIDRQPNAQRVEWEDSAFSQGVASNSTGTKRDHATAIEGDDIEIDPSQDEGFQQDDRSPDIPAKRRSKPVGGSKKAAQQRAPRKGRNSQAQRQAQSQAQSQADNDDLATTVSNYNQRGSPPPSTLDVYQASHDLALTVSASQPKKVQVRTAWTDEETQTLLELIEEHGTSWRLLKDIDLKKHHVLARRDQVALKDKARNMKLDFLKAGHNLPENFQYVPLNKIQIQKLHDLGLEYDQDRGRRTAS
ncbi:MAG: hypothetical protein Q9191_006768 [Dirinaria sp. TL-2023a]